MKGANMVKSKKRTKSLHPITQYTNTCDLIKEELNRQWHKTFFIILPQELNPGIKVNSLVVLNGEQTEVCKLWENGPLHVHCTYMIPCGVQLQAVY